MKACVGFSFSPVAQSEFSIPTPASSRIGPLSQVHSFSTKYVVPAYVHSWPDRPYIVLGYLDATTAPIRRRGVSIDSWLLKHFERTHSCEYLAEFLNLDHDLLHPMVSFIGNVEFKTPMPDNVLTKGLSNYIRRFTTPRIKSWSGRGN